MDWMQPADLSRASPEVREWLQQLRELPNRPMNHDERAAMTARIRRSLNPENKKAMWRKLAAKGLRKDRPFKASHSRSPVNKVETPPELLNRPCGRPACPNLLTRKRGETVPAFERRQYCCYACSSYSHEKQEQVVKALELWHQGLTVYQISDTLYDGKECHAATMKFLLRGGITREQVMGRTAAFKRERLNARIEQARKVQEYARQHGYDRPAMARKFGVSVDVITRLMRTAVTAAMLLVAGQAWAHEKDGVDYSTWLRADGSSCCNAFDCGPAEPCDREDGTQGLRILGHQNCIEISKISTLIQPCVGDQTTNCNPNGGYHACIAGRNFDRPGAVMICHGEGAQQ